MATQILHPGIFPAGTTVGAYPISGQPEFVTGKPPSGNPTETAVVAGDGSLTFTTLTEGASYYAIGPGPGYAYVRFQVSVISGSQSLADVIAAMEGLSTDLGAVIARLAADEASVSVTPEQVDASITAAIDANNLATSDLLDLKADRGDVDTVNAALSAHRGNRAGIDQVHGLPAPLTDAQGWEFSLAAQAMVAALIGTPATPPSTVFDTFDQFNKPVTLAQVPISYPFTDPITGTLKKTGDQTLVAGVPGLAINVCSYFLVCGGVGTVVLKSGATTLDRSHTFAGNYGIARGSRFASPIHTSLALGDPLVITASSPDPIQGQGGHPEPIIGGALTYYVGDIT